MASGKDSAASAATAAHEQKAIAARARALKLGLATMAVAQGGKAAKTAARGRNDATPAQQRLVEDPPEEQRFATPILSAGPRSTPGRSFGAAQASLLALDPLLCKAMAPPQASVVALDPLLCKALPPPQDQQEVSSSRLPQGTTAA